jgi:hypothetical protein
MSKGPVSLYAVFLPFIISYGFIFRFKKFKPKIIPFISFIILFLLIGLWWFVYVRMADPQAFLEIATKETGNWSSYNIKPFYYYWSFFTQSGLWTIPALIGLLYPYLIKKVQNKKAYKFTFWWTIIAVILLSLIPEKKARYLVPVLIPLALNTGFYIEYLIQSFSKLKLKKETIPVYFNFGLIATLSITLPVALYFLLKDNLQNFIINYIVTSVVTLIIGLLIFKYLFQKKMKHVFYFSIFFMMSILTFGLPLSKSINKNKEYKSINTLHQFEVKNNISTYSIGEIAPEFLWQYNGYLKNIYKNEELTVPSDSNFGILVMAEDIETVKSKLSNNYTLTLIETFNINFGAKSKERLIRHLYLVSKK